MSINETVLIDGTAAGIAARQRQIVAAMLDKGYSPDKVDLIMQARIVALLEALLATTEAATL